MDKARLISEFANAVDDMQKTKFDGVYYWNLGRDEKRNYWAIVLGWADGFEANENDDCMDGTYRLCVKLAYQPWNSLLQCGYDIDWLMPYDEETGEVDNTEMPIYMDTDIEEVVNWLLDCYASYEI